MKIEVTSIYDMHKNKFESLTVSRELHSMELRLNANVNNCQCKN